MATKKQGSIEDILARAAEFDTELSDADERRLIEAIEAESDELVDAYQALDVEPTSVEVAPTRGRRQRWTNWLKGDDRPVKAVVAPRDLPALIKAVTEAKGTIHVSGKRHADNALSRPDADATVIDLSQWPTFELRSDDPIREIRRPDGTRAHVARVWAWETVAQVIGRLTPHNLALINLGSFSGQTLGGPLSVGTHGSGAALGAMCDSVISVDVLLGDGRIVRVASDLYGAGLDVAPVRLPGRLGTYEPELRRDPALFNAAVVSLGRIGVVLSYEIEVTETYWLRERTRIEPLDNVLRVLQQRAVAPDVRHFEMVVAPVRTTINDVVDDWCVTFERRITDSRRPNLPELPPVLQAMIGTPAVTRVTARMQRRERVRAKTQALLLRTQARPVERVGPWNAILLRDMGVPAHGFEVAVPIEHASAAIRCVRRAIDAVLSENQHRPQRDRSWPTAPFGVRFVRSGDQLLAMNNRQRPLGGGIVGTAVWCFIEVPRLLGTPKYGTIPRRVLLEFDTAGVFYRVHWGQYFPVDGYEPASRYFGLGEWRRLLGTLTDDKRFSNETARELGLVPKPAGARTPAATIVVEGATDRLDATAAAEGAEESGAQGDTESDAPLFVEVPVVLGGWSVGGGARGGGEDGGGRGDDDTGVSIDDLLEVDWGDGVIEFIPASEVSDATGAVASTESRGAGAPPETGRETRYQLRASRSDSGAPELVRVHSAAGVARSRGVISWVARKIGRWRPAATMTARAIALKIDRDRCPDPGLKRWLSPENAVLTTWNAGEHPRSSALPGVVHAPEPGSATVGVGAAAASGKRWLLFVHGTASNTATGFEALVGSSTLMSLFEAFGGRVLAFEHRTLTESPVEQAKALIKALPHGAVVCTVSHSRGGIIVDLLSLACAVAEGVDAGISEAAYELDPTLASDIAQLGAAARERQITVDRSVRIATPARGTTLALKRLDRWVGMLFNVVKWVTPASPVVGLLRDFTLAVLAERANPDVMPGIEAMIPDSPLQTLLNSLPPLGADALTVVAGQTTGLGGGIGSRLGVLAADIFYGEANDLVVPTASMSGGLRRERSRPVVYERRTTHFAYFGVGSVQRALEESLTAPQPALGADERPTLPSRAARSGASRGGGARVLVLPGIMGSRLYDGDSHVWIDLLRLTARGLGVLDAARPLDARGLVDVRPYYRDLRWSLEEQGHTVVELPFDWRQPIATLGKGLGALLDDELREERPVHVVAHSMGGLVFRAAITDDPSRWRRFVELGGRLVMAGTPNHGSWAPMQILHDEHRLFSCARKLGGRARRMGDREAAEFATRLRGLMDMVPFAQGLWTQPVAARALALPDPGVQEAISAWQLALSPSGAWLGTSEAVLLVAGTDRTPLWSGDRFTEVDEGDGTVLDSSLRLPGSRLHFVRSQHSAIPGDGHFLEAVNAFFDGLPVRLPNTRPLGRRGESVAPPTPIDLYPTAETALAIDIETVAAAIYGPATPSAADARSTGGRGSRLHARVVHGEIRTAVGPVVVGHSEGDAIRGLEFIVDMSLGGRLRQSERLGCYPARVGDVRYFPGQSGEVLRGAVVIGIGDAHELGRGQLRAAFRKASLEFALAEEPGEQSRTLSAVLVARRTAPQVSIRGCVEAIVLGVADANQALQSQGDGERAIDVIEIVEYLDDVARQATEALQDVLRAASVPANFVLDGDPTLEVRRGGLVRNRGLDDDDSWLTVRVTTSESGDGGLRFEVQGNSTAAPTVSGLVDLERLRSFIRADRFGFDVAQRLAGRLFFPPKTWEAIDAGRDIRLVVDRQTATLPWEIIARGDTGSEPLAARVGLVRQLSTPHRPRSQSTNIALTAVVIGDTVSGDAALAPLPGAQAEGRAVVDILGRGGFRVKPAIVGDPVNTSPEDAPLLALLDGGSPAVLHIAAHGVVGATAADSGVVLGPGLLLDGRLFEQLGATPSLVVFNCCHSGVFAASNPDAGAVWQDFNRTLAESLLSAGARAVVMTAWEVGDDLALDFAHLLYEALLDGATFGTAVRNARSAIWRRNPSDATWAAYQAWGDPAWRLVAGRSDEEPVRFASVGDATDYLIDLQSRAALPWRGVIDRARRDLDRARDGLQPAWLAEPAVLAELGRAAASLGRYDEAVEDLDAAWSLAPRRLDIAIDLLAIGSKHLASGAPPCRDRVALRARLEGLLVGVETLFAHAMRGPEIKQLATARLRLAFDDLAHDSERRHHLERAREIYQSCVPADLTTANVYPLLGEIACGWALGESAPTALLERAASAESTNKGDFWARMNGYSVDLLDSLWGDGPSAELREAVVSTRREFGTPSELLSHRLWLRMLRRAAELRSDSDAAVVGRLASLVDAVERFVDDGRGEG